MDERATKLVTLMVAGGLISAIWQEAGYASELSARNVARSAAVLDALFEAREGLIQTDMTTEALQGLSDVLSGSGGPTKLAAVKLALSLGRHGQTSADPTKKATGDMTTAELQKLLIDLRSASRMDVTPHIGALPAPIPTVAP